MATLSTGNDENESFHSGGLDGSISMSIEETNKLREKLGLKPLELETKSSASKEVIVAPVLQAKPSEAEVRHRIDVSKARRAREDLISGGSVATDNDTGDLDPKKWVNKMRRLEHRKLLSASHNDDTSSDESGDDDEIVHGDADLEHLRVAHRLKDLNLKAGESVVLTLKDDRIINESGELNDSIDLLENPEVRKDVERQRRETEKKYGTAGVYNSLEDEIEDEEDPLGLLGEAPVRKRKRDILHHYDEWAVENKTSKKPKDIDLKRGFSLGDLHRHPANQTVDFPVAVDLTSTIGIQRDFMTREEAETQRAPVVFKKPKKKKKTAIRKTDTSLTTNTGMHDDDGPTTVSRVVELSNFKKKKVSILAEVGDISGVNEDNALYEQLATRRKAVIEASNPDEILEDDSKTLSLDIKKGMKTPAAIVVAEMVSVVEDAQNAISSTGVSTGMQSVGLVDVKADEPTENGASRFELSGTTEFCRALLTPLEKLEDIKLNRLAQPKPVKRGLIASKDTTSEKNATGKWKESQPTSENQHDDSASMDNKNLSDDDNASDSDGEGITEEEKKVVENILQENLLDGGLTSALSYLKSKGELTQDSWRMGRKNHENAPLHISTNPKDVKLEYKDDYGRIMTPKEAFRYISWVFHGKGPGKKKREKMLRKMELEKKMRSIASNQNKLPTMKALNKQQKTTGQAYVVLTSTPNNQ